MKRLLSAIAAAGMLLLTSAALAQVKDADTKAPPISQELVREGDFALDLAVVLKLGEPATETEAEDTLTNAGVSPKNGWIADYPMTPDILGEVGDAIGKAADSGKLKMKKDEALTAFNDLAEDYGLPVKSAGGEKYGNGPADSDNDGYNVGDTNGYEDTYGPSVVEEYYYDYGPPVVTYYTPPPYYYYLYSWVPYPFWCYGFWYPGYFILNDFTVVINIGDRHRRYNRDWDRDWDRDKVVSNHVRDKDRTVRLDPVTRKPWKSGATAASTSDPRSLRRDASRMDRKSAESILDKSSRWGGKRGKDTGSITTRPLERTQKSGGWSRSRDSGVSVGSTKTKTGTRTGRQDRAFERPTRLGDSSRGWGGGSRDSFRATPRDTGRSFERPTRLGDSFRAVPRDSGRSFDRPARLGDSSRGWSGGSGRSVGSAPSNPGRSFDSRPARSFEGGGVSRGGGGFNRGGGGGGWGRGGGCRGKNC